MRAISLYDSPPVRAKSTPLDKTSGSSVTAFASNPRSKRRAAPPARSMAASSMAISNRSVAVASNLRRTIALAPVVERVALMMVRNPRSRLCASSPSNAPMYLSARKQASWTTSSASSGLRVSSFAKDRGRRQRGAGPALSKRLTSDKQRCSPLRCLTRESRSVPARHMRNRHRARSSLLMHDSRRSGLGGWA